MADEKSVLWGAELLKWGGGYLLGFLSSLGVNWFNQRRKKPTLGIQKIESKDISNWAFDLVIENHWDTDLEVSDVEFWLRNPQDEIRVVKASQMPRFEDSGKSFYGDEKPPTYYRIIVEGKGIGKIRFEMLMLMLYLGARNPNKHETNPIKAVMIVDHLGRRECLGRKPLKTLKLQMREYMGLEQEANERRHSLGI